VKQAAYLLPASINVLEEHVTSIYRVKESVKQETSKLNSVISQKTELFITTAVRTSNPTFHELGLLLSSGDWLPY
jgi:hypothetical protein